MPHGQFVILVTSGPLFKTVLHFCTHVGQYPVIGHDNIISCIPPLIINPNSMVVAHVILVTALVQKIGLGFLETDSELSH